MLNREFISIDEDVETTIASAANGSAGSSDLINFEAFDNIDLTGIENIGHDTTGDSQADTWEFPLETGSLWMYDTNSDGEVDQMQIDTDGNRVVDTFFWEANAANDMEGGPDHFGQDLTGNGQVDIYGVYDAAGEHFYFTNGDEYSAKYL